MTVLTRFWLFCLFCISSISASAQAVDTAAVVREVDSLLTSTINFINQRNFEGAQKSLSQAERILLEKLDKKTSKYGLICHLYGVVAYYSGEYKEAEKWYLEAINVRGLILGKEHPQYIGSIHNLAYLYETIGEYEKSEQFFLQIKSTAERVWGKEHPDYISSLQNLGHLYSFMGNFEKAEQHYLETKLIQEKILTIEHPEYIGCLFNLATLYARMGNFEKAEPFFLRVKVNWEKTFGVEHPNYALFLNNLGSLYFELGNYKRAESIYLESKNIRNKSLGKEHPDYAQTLNNLAALYFKTGNYSKAEPLILEAITIREKSLGKEHPDYASSLFNLAVLYHETGNYEKTLPLYLESKNIREKTLGIENPEYAQSLSNLAVLYKDMGNYEDAESSEAQSRAIRKKILGIAHLDYVESLNNLSLLYLHTGHYEKLESLQPELSTVNKILLGKSSKHLSELEMGNYMAKISKNYSQTLSVTQLSKSKNIVPACYDNSLFYKGFLLNAANQIKHLAYSDSIAMEKYNLLKSYERRLSVEYSKPIGGRDSTHVAELEEKVYALEKDLTRTVAGYSEAMRQVQWQEILVALQSGEAAMEFVHYRFHDKKETDSTMYAAILLRSGSEQPEFLPLFEEKQLQSLLEKTGNNASLSSTLYAARSGELLDAAPAYGAELYNLIWRPIDSLLQANKIKTVYFSPSGLLYRVSFAALPVPPFRGGRGVLSDRYTLHQLGSTRSIVVKTPEPVAQNYSAAVFGGVRYDRTATLPADSTLAEITDNRLWNLIDKPAERGSDDGGFDYLPGTQQEARRLEQLLTQSRVRVQTHTGAQATEEALKALGRDTLKSPDILHIATHGFFFPDPEKRSDQRFGDENAFKWNENPLFRSGLALAGANAAWTGQPTPGNIEDGILTAYEISHLNLSNTKLAVLSACQTGLGDIKGSEGVYGLQRAFKMAGVDYLLVSLWQVPDKETAEFMDVFYKTWLGGKTIHEAFAKAQKKMRKKYKEVYKWGAWVLIQ